MIRSTKFCIIHLNHKRSRSGLHNIYMKKRVINFADNQVFGGVGEWGPGPYRLGRRKGIGGKPPAQNAIDL
jgi:hypothetical protein